MKWYAMLYNGQVIMIYTITSSVLSLPLFLSLSLFIICRPRDSLPIHVVLALVSKTWITGLVEFVCASRTAVHLNQMDPCSCHRLFLLLSLLSFAGPRDEQVSKKRATTMPRRSRYTGTSPYNQCLTTLLITYPRPTTWKYLPSSLSACVVCIVCYVMYFHRGGLQKC